MESSVTAPHRDERSSAVEPFLKDTGTVFESFFEGCIDAVWLFDPEAGVFVDCNEAGVRLIGAKNKAEMLQTRPEDLAPPFQTDGSPTRERSAEITALVAKHNGYRFEWLMRHMQGHNVPLEVSCTPTRINGKAINVVIARDITERKRAEADLRESEQKFRELFEASTDAISIFDPQTRTNIACNDATVKLLGGTSKDWFLSQPIESLSPERQPDGRVSPEVGKEWVARALTLGPQRFEWLARHSSGHAFPVEILLTPLKLSGRLLLVTVTRDISERKRAEQELLEMNQSLERRVVERTAALSTSEARLRALVEHAPEAIVVFDGRTGRIRFGNQHACRLYGVPMERLAQLTPADVSPEFQADGRKSSEVAVEKMNEALMGGMPVFEWIHRQPDGRLIPTEVRLLRLPAEGQNLIRASIIDNTERKRSERALRESEEKFRALFEGSSQGVLLQDEEKFLEVNPAAVRIMGCQSAAELIGKNPSDLSPPFQPNGESTDAMARRFLEECLNHGSSRFEWVARTADGKDIPLEVALTRIQWSGRQVIQALITDIRERQLTQAALAESEARFSAAFQASPIFIAVARMSDGRFVLVNDAFVNWSGYTREEILGRSTAELSVWDRQQDREAFWVDLRSAGSIRNRECSFRDRNGKLFTILLSSEVIQLNGVPHMLSMALDITERKQAEAELRASEARLRESEARFSAAFHASPILIAISQAVDGRFVLVNDAFVNWSGYSREEMLGQNAVRLGFWQDLTERQAFWQDLHHDGSVRERECQFQNRAGRQFTMLISAQLVQLDNVPHMLAMSLDITARKQAEAELRASEGRLRESEARFSVAFQASPVFINILRMSDATYVWANDAFVNRLGYPREEVLGRASSEFGLWADPKEHEQALKDMRDGGSIRQRECRWRNRHGEPFTILLSAETIKFNGEPHILSLALDITLRKRAEEELLKTLEREKELSQLKSNFVSMVSHEFRTPLGIIQSSSELLRSFYQRMQPDEREEQLDSISRNTRRMAGMMEEVLVLSRLDAGKLDFQPAALDLNIFCHRVVDEVQSATNRRCVIDLTLNSVPIAVQADERLLGHIFTNLLSNAVKYSEPGATVQFTVERDGSDAVCVVSDQGIGISEEDQKQLFKAFHRGGNVGTRPGTGLGLLLVKRSTELHGGKVQVNSKIGEGTRVMVKLPIFGSTYEKDTGH